MLAENLRNFILTENVHKDLDFKVVLVEHELDEDESPGIPDCIRVCESKPLGMEVVPNKKSSWVSDLRCKIKKSSDVEIHCKEENLSSEKEEKELYYEICYARPQCNSQWRMEKNHKIYTHLYPRIYFRCFRYRGEFSRQL